MSLDFKYEPCYRVSKETIYQYIYRHDKDLDLIKDLRTGKKRRNRRQNVKNSLSLTVQARILLNKQKAKPVL